MSYLVHLVYFCLIVLFSSCNKDVIKPQIITMQVADHQQDCVGVGPQKCLLVKTGTDTSWTYFYSTIDGFVYEPGYEYRLRVKRASIKNPPADGSSFQYSLLKVVEKIKK